MRRVHASTSRRRALMAAPLAAALLLAGCSGSSGTEGESGGGTEFTFTFATSNNLESPYQVLADSYVKSHPGVSIQTNPVPNDRYGETIRTQLQGGNASDVLQTTPGSGDARGIIPLAEAGFLEPLGDTARSLVREGSESVYLVDDQVYGQPLDFTVAALVASRGTAGRKGITEFPTTMSEFTEACRTMTEQGGSLLVVAGAAGPNVGLTIQGISATRVYGETPDWNQQRADGKTTFAASQGWKDTLQTFLDLNEAGCLQPGAAGAGFDAITNGLAQGTSVASFIPSGAAVEIARAAPPEADFAVEPFPPADGGKAMVLGSSNYTLSINKASEQKEAAKAFLDWLAEPAQQEAYYKASGELPVSSFDQLDLAGTVHEEIAPLLKDGAFAPLPNNIWPNPSVYDALQSGGQGLLTGQKSVDDVLADMDAAWDS